MPGAEYSRIRCVRMGSMTMTRTSKETQSKTRQGSSSPQAMAPHLDLINEIYQITYCIASMPWRSTNYDVTRYFRKVTSPLDVTEDDENALCT